MIAIVTSSTGSLWWVDMWVLCYFCLSVVLMLQWFYIARMKRQLDAITSAAAAFLEARSDG